MTERQLTNAQKAIQTGRKVKNIRARINQLLDNQYGKINAKTYNTIHRDANRLTDVNKLEKLENKLIALIPVAVDRRKAQVKKTAYRRAFKNANEADEEEYFDKLYDRYVDEVDDDGFKKFRDDDEHDKDEEAAEKTIDKIRNDNQ